MNSLNDAKAILKEAELFKDYNKTREQTLSIRKFSESFIRISQSNDYEKIYKVAMENLDYDFVLVDDSFFQFSCIHNEGSFNKATIRYAYYENPRSYMTYEEFLSTNEIEEEGGESFLDYYEQEKAEASLKNSVAPFRYDYDYIHYEAIHHPVSHMHIGHNNNVRVPLNKIITPAIFVVFVLRNVYLKEWKQAFDKERFRHLCLSAKNSCQDLDIDYFTEDEKKLLHIW